MTQVISDSELLLLHEIEIDDEPFVCSMCDRDPTWACVYHFPCPHDGVKDYFCDEHQKEYDRKLITHHAFCVDCGPAARCTDWDWEKL